MFPSIESDCLYLRPFKKEDSLRVKELANNKEITSILGMPYPYLVKYAEAWIDTHPNLLSNGSEYPLAIVSKEEKDIIGTITIRIDKENNKGELGYWIGRDYWGKGYATEAVKKMMDYGFNKCHLHKMWATALSRNKASTIVLEKSGLQMEAIFRENKRIGNVYEDVCIYGLLKREYLKQQQI